MVVFYANKGPGVFTRVSEESLSGLLVYLS